MSPTLRGLLVNVLTIVVAGVILIGLLMIFLYLT